MFYLKPNLTINKKKIDVKYVLYVKPYQKCSMFIIIMLNTKNNVTIGPLKDFRFSIFYTLFVNSFVLPNKILNERHCFYESCTEAQNVARVWSGIVGP